MSSGCQPSAPGAAALAGVQTELSCIPVVRSGRQPDRAAALVLEPITAPTRAHGLTVPSSALRASSSPSTTRSSSCAGARVEQVDRHHVERELGPDRLGQRLEHRHRPVARGGGSGHREHAAQVARDRLLDDVRGGGPRSPTVARLGRDDTVSPRVLGLIQRGVGARQQRGGVLRRRRPRRSRR